jgi:hypothetical protein
MIPVLVKHYLSINKTLAVGIAPLADYLQIPVTEHAL